LLRRRHLRVRRHAADRTPLLAGPGGAADRRPLPDGSARGRARLPAAGARPDRPIPLRDVIAPRRPPGRAAAACARRPGDRAEAGPGLVPADARELLDLDLTELTYG